MDLADHLRALILTDGRSLYKVSRSVGIAQSTLHLFVHGDKDGKVSDMRLSVAQKLIDYYGVEIGPGKIPDEPLTSSGENG